MTLKKVFILCCIALMGLSAQAGDYDYLIVENNDGSLTAYVSEGLSLNFEQSGATDAMTAKVTLKDGTTDTFATANTKQMYFSNEGVTTGIQKLDSMVGGAVNVYAIDGKHLGTFPSVKQATETLPSGCYIMKSGTRTIKLTTK